jgi:hypothetical protein
VPFVRTKGHERCHTRVFVPTTYLRSDQCETAETLAKPWRRRNTGSNPVTAGDRAFGLLVGAISDGQRAGLVRRRDVEELAVAASALVHGLSALIIDGQLRRRVPNEREAQRLATRVTKLLQTGFARRDGT